MSDQQIATRIPGRFAVIGEVIAHSQSPQIHTAFAQQFDRSIEYVRLQADADAFAATLHKFFAEGGHGANITLPFKQEAYALCTERSAEAEQAQAVNTIWRTSDWHGANTDGGGFSKDLRANLQVKIHDRTALIIGAGGATRGVLGSLLELRPAQITIANRTLARADELAADFSHLGSIKTLRLDALASFSDAPFDLIIQASSAGHQGALPELAKRLCTATTLCYDLNYGSAAQPFLDWAHSTEAELISDGLGMLVEQAALSFRLWLGLEPATQAVIAKLRGAP